MSLYEQAQDNVRLAYFHGQRHRCPNGELGTVLMCPWPGCKEEAVEGWSACGGHFADMHPIRHSVLQPPELRRPALHFWAEQMRP
jgi:hypothetical protein